MSDHIDSLNGGKGPTVTMFAPYDCHNSCPFCVNKREYRDSSAFDLERCFASLDIMHRIFPNNDIVFTGGEPLAELDTLERLIEHVHESHNLYINTTLPIADDSSVEETAAVLNKYRDRISCINVSRHTKKYVVECPDRIFDLLKVRHRINCVVFGDATKEELIAFLDRFNGHEIQLRSDYSKLTLDNVFETEGDHIFELISSIAEFERPLDKELFRTGFVFKYKDSTVTYHKTLPYSKVEGHIGDIIIRQNGLIYDDWNDYGHELNINALTM